MILNETKIYAIVLSQKSLASAAFFLSFCNGRSQGRPFWWGMAKEFARKFYSSKQWQDCRNGYAAMKGYLCENCLRNGIYKPGVIVHHLEELTPLNIHRPEVTLNYSNLELLCRECHKDIHGTGGRWDAVNEKKREKKRKARRFLVGENGKIFANIPPY